MKKTILIFFIFNLVCALVSAKDRYYESPFEWKDPTVLSQGGSFVSNGSGFSSLLVNPASFAKYDEKEKKGEIKKKGEMTFLSIGGAFAGDFFEYMEESRNTDKDILELILDQVTSSGLGSYASMGGGYVGRGFGFGLLSVVDFDAPPAETTLGLTGDIMWTSGFIGGYAHPFELGQFKLVLGADIRPMYRFSAKGVDVNSLTGAGESGGTDFDDVDAMGGFAVAFDLGTDLHWRDLTASITMRDIGNTRWFYEPVDGAFGMSFSGNDVDEIYITPWTLNFGLSYNPTIGRLNRFVDITVHGSFEQPLISEDSIDLYNEQSAWTRLNLGAEVVLLSSIALRTGLQGGYFTAGFGLDLFVVELNAALYAKELGSNAGDQPQMGGAMELAFRY